MRVLVIGAGAVGGYFGGRLLQVGRDVTFLVRPPRAAQLSATGLSIKSAFGDAVLDAPTVVADRLRDPFDLILLSCKAYDLDAALDAMAPAVGTACAILPLLNGIDHLDRLRDRFGAQRVLGGTCAIAATLDDAGRIVHLNEVHSLIFGELDGAQSARIAAISELFASTRTAWRASPSIVLEMWEKWVMLATLAGSTCLLRAAVGDIVAAPGGTELIERLFEECRSIAIASGHAPRSEFFEKTRPFLTATGSTLTASMLRDIERGGRIEADHIVGDLIRRGETAGQRPELLRVVYTHLKAYAARQQRSAAAPAR